VAGVGVVGVELEPDVLERVGERVGERGESFGFSLALLDI
jgi:hypothetical protein